MVPQPCVCHKYATHRCLLVSKYLNDKFNYLFTFELNHQNLYVSSVMKMHPVCQSVAKFITLCLLENSLFFMYFTVPCLLCEWTV